MPRRIERAFKEDDREAIRAATAAAETQTAAELVVYVTERCDPHPEVAWKGSLIGAAVGALLGALGVWLFGGWGMPNDPWILLGLQLGLLAGWLASRIDPIARRLVDEKALDARVEGRASEAFLKERVFQTQQRTGVLIFVALFEHRVMVLADEGVAAHVRAGSWDDLCQELAEGLRRGSATRAIVNAIGRCVDLLTSHGVPGADATNQLSDEPRFDET